MRWMKIVAAVAALSMAGFALPATAQAGHKYGHGWTPHYGKHVYVPKHRGRYVYHHRRSRGDALAAGIIGFTAGALIAGALAQPRYPRVHAPAHVPVYGAPIYGAPPVGSPDWYAYCASKFQSFDPADGTFQPFNGPRRLCQ